MISRLISLFVLGPFLLYPFSYCPFKLPYLYCYLCPIRCSWFRIRGLALLIIIGLNMQKGLFCNHICPLGTIQALLSKLNQRKVVLPKFLGNFKYLSIVLILLIVATTWRNQLFLLKARSLLWTIFSLGLILSIFSHQFLCHNLCPGIGMYKIRYHFENRLKVIAKRFSRIKALRRK